MYSNEVDVSEIAKECREHFYMAKDKAPFINLTAKDMEWLKNLAKISAESASVEVRQAQDSEAFASRFLVGYIGEFAFSKLLGYPHLFRGSCPGGSFANTFSDASYLGYKLGVKCSHIGKSVKIGYKEKDTQLICQYVEYDDGVGIGTRVYFMGFLEPVYIPYYCKREYVESQNLRKKGTKGGFVAFDRLIPFTKENLSKYESPVKIQNYLYNAWNSNIVDVVKNSCIYMEKRKGYDVLMLPKPAIPNKLCKYYTVNVDLEGVDKENHEALFNWLSTRIIVGYGISGYLYKMQSAYAGNKEFVLKYIDLDDVIRMYNINDSTEVSALWVNKLYSWRDYIEKWVSVYQEQGEHWVDYHYRLVMAFLDMAVKIVMKQRQGVVTG